MAKTNTKIATMHGTLLKPGVSKNHRLYTLENIRSAAEAAQADLKAGKTLNMYVSHSAAATDNPLQLVGQFTKVWQEDDGSLKFEADVPNTSTGRDYAAIADGKFQRTISIRGGWGSTPTVEDFNGKRVITAPTLRLGGADGTASPGVEGAAIEGIDFLESEGNFDPASYLDITESADVEIEPFTEEAVSPVAQLAEEFTEAVLNVLREKTANSAVEENTSTEASTETNDQSTEAEQQTQCPACGKGVSAALPACPYCEGPISQVESADNTEETTNKEKAEMSETNTTAGTADTATASEEVVTAAATEAAPVVPVIDYKALADAILSQQKATEDAAAAEAAAKAAAEAAQPVTYSAEEMQAVVKATAESVSAEVVAKAIEDARRSGDIQRTGYATSEAATPYYEAVQEGEEAQATFLGKLSAADLAKQIAAVASDGRNLMGFAPRFASNRV